MDKAKVACKIGLSIWWAVGCVTKGRSAYHSLKLSEEMATASMKYARTWNPDFLCQNKQKTWEVQCEASPVVTTATMIRVTRQETPALPNTSAVLAPALCLDVKFGNTSQYKSRITLTHTGRRVNVLATGLKSIIREGIVSAKIYKRYP